MKKIISIILCFCIVSTFFGCQTAQNIKDKNESTNESKKEEILQTNEIHDYTLPQTAEMLSYDPDKIEIAGNASGEQARRSIPENMFDLEQTVRHGSSWRNKSEKLYFQNGIIAEFKVTGGSINRIIYNPYEKQLPDVIYGFNHMLTEVTITKIHYKGPEVPLNIGDKIYLFEWSFYTTEETSWLLDIYGMNALVSEGANYPVEKNKEYIFFGEYYIAEPNNQYYYNALPVIRMINDGLFDISRTNFKDGHKKEMEWNESRERPELYENTWNEVKQKYGKINK